MLAPDGTQGMVDAESSQQAVDAGYRPALQMRAPNGGAKGLVALTDMGQALKAGYQTEGQYQQSLPSADANSSGGLLNGAVNFLTSAGGAVASGVKGAYHTVVDPPQTPMEQGAAAQPMLGGQLGTVLYRMTLGPQIDQAQKALAQTNSPDTQTRLQAAAHALAAVTPIAGPMAANLGDTLRPQLESGNYSGAAGTLAGNALLAEATRRIGNAAIPESNVAGQNYRPSHAAAFEGLTAKANGMGTNFIPQNLTSDALSPIRQSASDMLANGSPTEQAIAQAATARGTAPLDRLGAVHSVIQKSLSDLEAQHAPALAQVSGNPVDMTPIQRGLQQQIVPGMSDADVAGIRDLIQRSGQIKTLGDLNNFRGLMNDEASPSYRQSPTQANRASAPQQVVTDAANAVRAHYFDQMEQATGTNFQPLKNQESKILTAKEAIERMQSPEAKAEATFNAPTTIRESAGNVANLIKEPRATVTQTILRESPATRASMLIRKSLTNLPEPTPATPQGIPPPNVPQLPATASPTVLQGTPVAPAVPLASLPPAIQRILALTRGEQ